MDNNINKKSLDEMCPLYKKCNGCQLQNMKYSDQLRFKQRRVDMLLTHFCHVNKIIGMAQPKNYRNKLQAVYRKTKNNELISGIYQSSNNGIVATDSCMLTDERANKISSDLRRLFKSFKIKPYDPVNDTGYVRNVIIRCGYKTEEIMVLIVARQEENLFNRSFVNALVSANPQIKCVALNVNKSGKLLNGKPLAVLYGDGKIRSEICENVFMLSPQSFYQVNSLQTEVLYSKALELAQIDKADTVIDAYCGIGTIGIIAAQYAKDVIGVELNSSAVADARLNAKLNKRDNISFFSDDAGRFMRERVQKKESADIVFCDPPRSGCTLSFLKSLVAMSPKKLIYISCNPETLARDLRFLTKNGYTACEIQPVDMFPYTKSIEVVVSLRKNSR